MNQPCQNCGRIITVPDIPLPAGYTQRCTSCGVNNPIGEDAPRPQTNGAEETEATNPSWSSSQGESMDFLKVPEDDDHTPALDSTEDRMLWKLEEKIRDLETRLKRDQEQTGPTAPNRVRAKTIQPPRPIEADNILICSRNRAIFENCRTVLGESGFQLHLANDLGKALKLMERRAFHVHILEQDFLNSGEKGRLVFRRLVEMPLAIRRWQIMILITPGIATGESQVFYQWGIDLNIHPRDLDRLDHHLAYVQEFKAQLLGCFQ